VRRSILHGANVGSLKPRLELRILKGISKELESYGLMMSLTVWITGRELAVPMERVAFLHKTQEAKHSLRLEVFTEAQDTCACQRVAERKWRWARGTAGDGVVLMLFY